MRPLLANLRPLGGLGDDTHAGVTTLVALAAPVVLGAAGLAFDLNRGYQQLVINQRAADLAALSAALAFEADDDEAVLTPTAQAVARANGLADATVCARLVADEDEQAIRVTVEERLPIMLGRVLGVSGTYPVSAQALASLGGGEPPFAAPCYLAMSGGANAFVINGGAQINSPGCSVAAVGKITNGGTLISASDVISGASDIALDWGEIAANSLRFAGSFQKPAWNTKAPPEDKWVKGETTLTDPWAEDADRIAAEALLGHHEPVPNLSNPVTPGGGNWSFDGSATGPLAAWRQPSGHYLVPAGTYDIGQFNVAGGVTVRFASGSIIRVAGGVAIGGGSNVDFGNSDLYVNGGFNSGSNGVRIGNGALWIGEGPVSFQGSNVKGDGDVVINATMTLAGGQHLTMGSGNHSFRRLVVGGGGTAKLGAGNFAVRSGLHIKGGSEVSLGAGNVNLGPHSDGMAIRLDGSAKLLMGNGAFSAKGNIQTEGGSRLAFGRTANHYIDGNMTIAGAVLFGSGRYTIDGNFTNGTGGTTWPYTSPLTGITYGQMLEGVSVSGYDQAGIDVTFILSGTMNLGGGAKTRLEAPQVSVPGGAIAQLLLSSQSSAASNWNAGSQNRFGGTIHLPNSALTMAGGNSTSTDGCLSLIASQIVVSGGAPTGSACDKMANIGAGAGGGKIRLIG